MPLRRSDAIAMLALAFPVGLASCKPPTTPSAATISVAGAGGLEGRLLDPAGKPAAGVILTLRASLLPSGPTSTSTVPAGGTTTAYRIEDTGLSAVTDAGGHFAFSNVPAATYGLEAVQSSSMKAATQSLIVAPGQVLEVGPLQLAPTGTITGHVQQQTLPGIAPDLAAIAVGLPGLPEAVQADANGNYALLDMPAGTDLLTASEAGFVAAYATASVSAGQFTIAPTMAVGIHGGGVTGKASLAAQSNAAGITVSLQIGTVTVATAVTGSDGSYAFAHVPQGNYTLAFGDPGHISPTPIAVAVQDGATTAVPQLAVLDVAPLLPTRNVAGSGISFATGLPAGATYAASGGDTHHFLVVWSDGSQLRGTVLTDFSPYYIAFSIATTGNPSHPAIAWNGTDFLVAWQDGSGGLHAVSVTASATLGSPFSFGDGSADSQVALAASGTSFLATWTATGSPDQVKAQPLTTTGTSGAAFPVASSADDPAIADDGPDALVAWRDTASSTARIEAALTPASGPAGNPVTISDGAASSPELPAVGWNGATFLVGWQDARNNGLFDLYTQQVTTAPAISGANTDAFAAQLPPASASVPWLAYTGSEFQAPSLATLWPGQVLPLAVGQVLTAGGAASGTPFNVDTLSSAGPVVAANGQDFLYLWLDATGNLLGQGVSP